MRKWRKGEKEKRQEGEKDRERGKTGRNGDKERGCKEGGRKKRKDSFSIRKIINVHYFAQ